MTDENQNIDNLPSPDEALPPTDANPAGVDPGVVQDPIDPNHDPSMPMGDGGMSLEEAAAKINAGGVAAARQVPETPPAAETPQPASVEAPVPAASDAAAGQPPEQATPQPDIAQLAERAIQEMGGAENFQKAHALMQAVNSGDNATAEQILNGIQQDVQAAREGAAGGYMNDPELRAAVEGQLMDEDVADRVYANHQSEINVFKQQAEVQQVGADARSLTSDVETTLQHHPQLATNVLNSLAAMAAENTRLGIPQSATMETLKLHWDGVKAGLEMSMQAGTPPAQQDAAGQLQQAITPVARRTPPMAIRPQAASPGSSMASLQKAVPAGASIEEIVAAQSGLVYNTR